MSWYLAYIAQGLGKVGIYMCMCAHVRSHVHTHVHVYTMFMHMEMRSLQLGAYAHASTHIWSIATLTYMHIQCAYIHGHSHT